MTTFDTLTAAQTLEDAGMDAKQAAAVTAAIRTAITEGVATRADIADLRTEMAAMETRMTRTLYGVAAALLAGQLAAVLALLRLLG